MIQLYARNPIYYEVVKWTGENLIEVEEFCNINPNKKITFYDGNRLKIKTSSGLSIAYIGNYIIKTEKCSFYTSKSTDFLENHTEVGEFKNEITR